jgi:uncharacterized oligopeptide transporter (OPT) family protein
MGVTLPAWSVALLGTAAALLGIAAATLLRRKLVVEDALPFPTGSATAEVIETIHAARATALRRALVMVGTAAAAMLVTWFREGKPKLIPQMLPIGGTLTGFAAASLTLGFSCTPVLLGTGAMIGLRSTVSLLLGAAIAWVGIAPWLLRGGIVPQADYGPLSSWLAFPGLGLLIAGSFVPLLLQAGAVLRSLRDMGVLVGGRRSDPRLALLATTGVVVVIVACGQIGVGIVAAAIAVLLALLLANVSARATGETDIAPVGQVGLLTQIAFASGGTLTSMVAAWISTAISSQTAQTLWGYKAGQRLNASPRAQMTAQLLGALVGGVVVVPVYIIIVKGYGLGTEAMPAASAQSWKAMAEAVRGTVPPHALLAGAIGVGAGTVLALLGRTRAARLLPSPAAMGLAMLIPAAFSLTAFAGALTAVVARRVRPALDETTVLTAAAGAIAGESMMGVVVAALGWAGLL